MKVETILRVVFLVAIALAFAGSAGTWYSWQVMSSSSGAPDPVMGLLFDVFDNKQAASTFAVMLCLVSALYRSWGQPRVSYALRRPTVRLIIALIGGSIFPVVVAFETVVGFESSRLGTATPQLFYWANLVAFFGLPVFLLGLGLMVLWEPVSAWDPMASSVPPLGPGTMK